jgi:hypothetical protein
VSEYLDPEMHPPRTPRSLYSVISESMLISMFLCTEYCALFALFQRQACSFDNQKSRSLDRVPGATWRDLYVFTERAPCSFPPRYRCERTGVCGRHYHVTHGKESKSRFVSCSIFDSSFFVYALGLSLVLAFGCKLLSQ